MAREPRRVGFHLPLKCAKHGNVIFVKEADELANLDGGCRLPCGGLLSCSHECPLRCHPGSHSTTPDQNDTIQCDKLCQRQLRCGHICKQLCHLECKSDCACKPMEDSGETLSPMKYSQVVSTSRPEVDNAQRQLLDEENASALFGSTTCTLPMQQTDQMNLVRVKDDGAGGQRRVWQGTYRPLQPERKRKEQTSLLD